MRGAAPAPTAARSSTRVKTSPSSLTRSTASPCMFETYSAPSCQRGPSRNDRPVTRAWMSAMDAILRPHRSDPWRPIRISGIATATSRERLASRAISHGPRLCPDDVGIDLRLMDQRWYWPSPQRVGRQSLTNGQSCGHAVSWRDATSTDCIQCRTPSGRSRSRHWLQRPQSP